MLGNLISYAKFNQSQVSQCCRCCSKFSCFSILAIVQFSNSFIHASELPLVEFHPLLVYRHETVNRLLSAYRLLDCKSAAIFLPNSDVRRSKNCLPSSSREVIERLLYDLYILLIFSFCVLAKENRRSSAFVLSHKK